jgi:hypothetical protein
MAEATSSALRAQSSVRSSKESGMVRDMDVESKTACQEGLRVRRCADPTCSAMFTICANCDRGQRYSGDACRARMRRQQVLAAGRRYQESEAGRQNHCRRQQSYRERRVGANMTHQGRASIRQPQPSNLPSLSRYLVCGQQSRWINPFSWVPRRRRGPAVRRRSARSSKTYVFG